MKKIILISIIFLLSFSSVFCARDPNLFNINGKTVRIEGAFLKSFREKWEKKESVVVTSGQLSKNDVVWIRDYISIIETLYDEKSAPLSLVETRVFDSDRDIDETDPDIVSGAFDYVWVVKNKKGIRKYRVVNPKEEDDFIVYPMNLNLITK